MNKIKQLAAVTSGEKKKYEDMNSRLRQLQLIQDTAGRKSEPEISCLRYLLSAVISVPRVPFDLDKPQLYDEWLQVRLLAHLQKCES